MYIAENAFPQGLKPRISCIALTARLKPCPFKTSNQSEAPQVSGRMISRLAMEGCGIPPLPQKQRRGKDGARRIQAPSATGLILADQCWTKSKAPSGRNSSAGAFHPRVFLGR